MNREIINYDGGYKEERESKIEMYIIWVLGRMAELKEAGLVNGGTKQLSETGLKEYQRIKSLGFRPEKEELINCLRCPFDVSKEERESLAKLMLMRLEIQ